MMTDVSEIRHRLRTSLNHILGYSEILIEDAAGAELNQAAGSLESIRAISRQLLDAVQGLGQERDAEAELAELRGRMEAPLREIAGHIEEASQSSGGRFRDDMERIRSAAEALRAFTVRAEEGAAGAAPARVVFRPAGEERQAGRLLVVDDDENNRDLLSRQLDRQGYIVVTASHGREALQLLSRGSFDLVLLDIRMPDLDGFDVLAQMKSAAPWREIPVIMISALDEVRSAVRCIELGAEDYLVKPSDPVLLRARIGACLEKKKLRDEEKKRTEELEDALLQLRRTQDRLIVQEKLASLGALTAGIAHEIKNPLNFITNFASISRELIADVQRELAGGAGLEETLRENLADIESNMAKIEEHGRRADRIVRGMLMHSRTAAGERQTTDINALVSEAVNLAYHGLRAQDSQFNVSIETELDSTIGPVSVVPQDISRVFLNIVNNACYAAWDKSRTAAAGFEPAVKVRTRNLGRHFQVCIRDNGNGIPPDVRARIFDPFFTTKPAGIGTGLGLSMSHDIVVVEHKGEIEVKTEPGSHTEFLITIPKEAPSA